MPLYGRHSEGINRMSAEASFSFPSWPRERVLREAVNSWSLRKAHEERCDPETSEWPFVCNVVLAWLRHELTQYDKLRDSETRDKLREEIRVAARRHYPWLRPDIDPRSPSPKSPRTRDPRYLNRVSAYLAELVSERARLSQAIALSRRTKEADARKRVKEMEARITEIDGQIEHYSLYFQTMSQIADQAPPNPERADWRLLIWLQRSPEYSFGGRNDLPPNITQSASFKCAHCTSTVLKTKRELDLGAGIKLICLSCLCSSIAVTRKQVPLLNAERWATLRDIFTRGKEEREQ